MPLKENFCSRPFNELHIEEDGKVTPCCVMPSNRFYFGENLKDYVRSDKLKEIKKAFMKGENHPYCEYCWESEKLGIQSHRKKDTSDLKNTKYIHLRLNNVCNFKCRMCNPNFSSTWEIENRKHKYFQQSTDLKRDIFEDNDYLFEFLKRNISEGVLQNINISGGEPLITDAHYKLLKFLIDNKLTNIHLSYSTNLSNLTYKNHDLISMWKTFDRVLLDASCDGWGPTVEYSRTGFNTEVFKSNLIKALKHVNVRINCVVNVYSVWTLPSLHKLAKKFNIKVSYSPLYYPEFLNPQRLSSEHKYYLKNLYKNIPELENVYSKHIKTDLPQMYSELIEYNVLLDKYRNTDFFKNFPMFEDYK